ncbi:MAG: hypothetical protein EXQ85_09590 [Alphaproteobacteria bacterium]|nr:hypothetical protein [Alphaproteobacteria bacterium]
MVPRQAAKAGNLSNSAVRRYQGRCRGRRDRIFVRAHPAADDRLAVGRRSCLGRGRRRRHLRLFLRRDLRPHRLGRRLARLPRRTRARLSGRSVPRSGARRYPHLFSPLALGRVTLKNRATMVAHGMRLGDHTGTISPRHHAYLVARARGGAAVVSASSLPVHLTSQRFTGLQIRVSGEALVPSLAKTATAVRRAGAKLAITLWHAGYNVSPLADGVTVAPSAVPNSRGEVPKALSLVEIKELIAAYVDAAKACRTAGVDILEVQTASDYLLASFLSPPINRCTDGCGGSPDNRLRIVREILAAVRAAAGPDLAVGVRTAVAHHTQGATPDYDIDESLYAMRSLARAWTWARRAPASARSAACRCWSPAAFAPRRRRKP